MFVRIALVFASALALAAAGCPTSVGVDGPCEDGDPSCTACSLDSDCRGAPCVDGVCQAPGDPLPAGDDAPACTATSACPLDQFCNAAAGACEPLQDGWCRQPGDCSGGTPICSAASSSVPGLCVQCVRDADCSTGERCGGGGVCQGDASAGDSCPPNSTTAAGGGCTCNAGFHFDVQSRTCQADIPSSGCVDHASPVPGQPGRCECDPGYQPSPSGNECVRPPPSGGGTDGGGNTGGGNTGGGTDGGGSGGTEDSLIGNCGPNTIAIYFLCFCLPGFAPNPNGDIGCSEADDEPTTGDDGGAGSGGDVCEENGWYDDDVCDTFCANPDPDCQDSGGGDTGGESDVCADNNWYGDDVCDTFCPNPDPDCTSSGGDTGGDTGGDVCEDNGWYHDGVCDEFCPNPDPDCAADDVCADNGWYDDGVCDDFCVQPDPDCGGGGGGSSDICADYGWYGDMVCDEVCASPDPDCSDVCVTNDWYGDGECDTFCDLEDPDC